jgi:hypothetical protein
MIHHLTGGQWGESAGRVLRVGAILVPAVALSFVPIALALPALYPWAADPASVPTSVQAWYLNPVAFWTRATIVLGVWSILGVSFGLGRGGPLLAGLGLAFSAVAIIAIAVDWFLSGDPRYVSSAFAFLVAARIILTALAVVAIIGPPTVGRSGASDIAALMVAGLLACAYLELMTFIVAWYGNLPRKAAWYLARSDVGCLTAITAAIILALIALVTLLWRRRSDSWRGLRVAGLATLGALALESTWLIAPTFADPRAAAGTAFGGLGVLILMTLALRPRTWTTPAEPSHEARVQAREPASHVYDEWWQYPRRAPEMTHHATMPIEAMHEQEQLEDPAVENRPVLASIVAFVSLVVVCIAAAYAYVWVEFRQRLALEPVTAPEPQLQIDPAGDLQRFQRSQRATLSGYGWVDKSSGVVRIPIERAMEIIAQRGNAAFDDFNAPAPPPPQRSGALP